MKAIIAYIPALHQGYLNFLNRYPGVPLYILERSLLEEFGELHLERDLRALAPGDTLAALTGIHCFRRGEVPERDISFVNAGALEYLVKTGLTEAVMPDEDISRLVAEKYLVPYGVEVTRDTVFLRWDKSRAVLERDVPADRVVPRRGLVARMMNIAETEAERSSDWWRHIGAAIVRDGTLLAIAHNEHFPNSEAPYIFGDPRASFDAGEHIELCTAEHAEAALIAAMARQGTSLEGAELFVTTFPCPPCARLLARSGIKRLYFTTGYSRLDALEVLRSAHMEIVRVE